jgi:hypothetical protein
MDDTKKRVYGSEAPKPQQPMKKPSQRYEGSQNLKSGSMSFDQILKNLKKSVGIKDKK